MTQENKELLLKDLCGRLPYGVKCHFKYGAAEDDVTLGCIDNGIARFEYGWYGRFHVSIDADYIKPYLRTMSSMTEEENDEWRGCLLDNLLKSCDFQFPESEKYIALSHSDSIDWLNKNHFDYRGLIPMGLALEATKDMYNTKTE
jgi:hypothetical protein